MGIGEDINHSAGSNVKEGGEVFRFYDCRKAEAAMAKANPMYNSIILLVAANNFGRATVASLVLYYVGHSVMFFSYWLFHSERFL